MTAPALPQKGESFQKAGLTRGALPVVQDAKSGQKGDQVVGGETDFDLLADAVVVVRGQQ